MKDERTEAQKLTPPASFQFCKDESQMWTSVKIERNLWKAPVHFLRSNFFATLSSVRPSILIKCQLKCRIDDVNNMPNRLFSTLLSSCVRHPSLPSNVISALVDLSPLIKVISYSRHLELSFHEWDNFPPAIGKMSRYLEYTSASDQLNYRMTTMKMVVMSHGWSNLDLGCCSTILHCQ